MDEELKTAVEEMTGSVVALKSAIDEVKENFGKDVPADQNEKLVKMAEELTELSGMVRKLDEAPAFKRAFEPEETTEAKRKTFEYKRRIPSSVSQDEEMKDFFAYQDALEVIKFLKRHDGSFRPESTKCFQEMLKIAERKAAYDGGAGTGAEWIPTGYSPDLVRVFELERQIASLFTLINMPNDPFKIPQQTSAATAYIKTRLTAPTESESGTDDVTLSCVTIAAYSKCAYEVEEDAIIAMIPFIRSDLATALATGEEEALINGDDSQSHQDVDVTSAADVRKAWKGLRKLASDSGCIYDLGTPTTTGLRAMRASMGKYAVNPRRLAWIPSPVGLIHLLGLDEVITLEKYGPQATVITGELGRFDGAPVVPSGIMREDLNASGANDGETETKTGLLLVNRSGYVIGRRRAPMIESFRDVVAGADEIVASMREDFQPRYPTTQDLTCYGYDVPNTIDVGS